ncbi:MAG TPA: hypothetical protein VFP59_03770 [Candidatus Angelobacter sp.]|nr:hypothetical protein [Candidatus Angelobacter sp.]
MFRKFISAFLTLILLAPQSPAQQKPLQAHKVPRGQGVKLATVTPISSATAKKGQEVLLRVVEPLTWQSVTLLAAGDLVHARISKVKHAKPSCSDGKISVEVSALTLANAGTVKARVEFINPDPDFPVRAQILADPMNAGEWVAAGVLVGIAVPFAAPYAAAEALVHRCSGLGNDYVLPAGATVAVAITEDYTVSY